ncbi:hypothetical protein GTB64_004484 [Salmonella enterica]|nr:hypothetical protein [Salmonella enterica]
MSITIPVGVKFDAADTQKQIQILNDQIKVLGHTVAQAQKLQFNPISAKSKEDMAGIIKASQKLLAVNAELQQKMKQSGQGGLASPLLADWSKMYPDLGQRLGKIRNFLSRMEMDFERDFSKPEGATGSGVRPPRPPTPNTPAVPPPPGGGRGWGGWGQQGMNVVGSGLNAMGPIGGVFSNAMRSGMSGGASAGMMGLVGGLAALGVGKIIGAIADKIDKAQDAAIGMDKIYRQIGGIASYSSIKGGTLQAANKLGVSINEMVGLGSSYARAANLRRGDNLTSGLEIGGGLSRSYGLDLSTGINFIGGMRGANITQSDKDSRRLGLIIGETIAKSDAFGKADEVMAAISQFAIAQARQSLTTPNIAAYGGAMSSLLGMKLPGMDVQGASALLGRVNASMMNGGAAGEAGKNFFNTVAMRNGMNPFQFMHLQEQGMFGTMDTAFGANSPYGKTFGAGPTGDQSFYSMMRDELGRRYGKGTPQYFMAMKNLGGIGISQAETLDKMSINSVNGINSRLSRAGIDLSKVEAGAYGDLGQIESGKGLDQLAQRYRLMRGDKALTAAENERLTKAGQSGNVDDYKQALTEIVAKRNGVETEGSQIRDNIAKLDNTTQNMASRLLEPLNVMRMALVKMAGTSEADIKSEYMKREKAASDAAIDAKYAGYSKTLRERDQKAFGGTDGKAKAYSMANMRAFNIKLQAEKDAAYRHLQNRVNGVDESGPGGTDESYTATPAGLAAANGSYEDAGAFTPAESNSQGITGYGGASGNMAGFNVGNLRRPRSKTQFARYTSIRAGMAAMASQLLRYQAGKTTGKQLKSLRQIISTYAPSSENRTGDYIANVAKSLGISPDEEIDLRDKNMMRKVMRAMITMENGDRGLAAAEGHYDEAYGDAMGRSSNFSKNYPQREMKFVVDLNYQGQTTRLEHQDGQYHQQHPYKVGAAQ